MTTRELTRVLAELNLYTTKLPPRAALDIDTWIASCASVMPRDTWARFARLCIVYGVK